MICSRPHLLVTASWLGWLAFSLINALPAKADGPIETNTPPQLRPSTPWQILDKRTGQGEQCLVCNKSVFDMNVVEVRYKGRVFHVADGKMFQVFQADPQTYFRKLQARSVLFDEMAVQSRQMSMGWLGLGLYVLLGLITGAACAYVAIAKGLRPVPWFFGGLFGSVVAIVAVFAAPTRRDLTAPAGIPSGLAKVPTTYGPQKCNGCGSENHPSATKCSGCGSTLTATVESEVTRTTTGS